MHFDEEFIKSLPEDIPSAIVAICEIYSDIIPKLPAGSGKHVFIKEAFGFIAAFSEVNDLGLEIPLITNDYNADRKLANKLFRNFKEVYLQQVGRSEFVQYKNIYTARLGKVFHYEFSEGDLGLIQNLINELRELIAETKELKEEHKRRLLSKLEKVQSELHKRVSDLDRFWGFCLDLSIVIGLMGKNAEPAADLVKKIVAIIWPAQTRAYELPSSLPLKLLGQSEDDKS